MRRNSQNRRSRRGSWGRIRRARLFHPVTPVSSGWALTTTPCSLEELRQLVRVGERRDLGRRSGRTRRRSRPASSPFEVALDCRARDRMETTFPAFSCRGRMGCRDAYPRDFCRAVTTQKLKPSIAAIRTIQRTIRLDRFQRNSGLRPRGPVTPSPCHVRRSESMHADAAQGIRGQWPTR